MHPRLKVSATIFSGLIWASGCAGPATPLGAVWELRPSHIDSSGTAEADEESGGAFEANASASTDVATGRGPASEAFRAALALRGGTARVGPVIRFFPRHQVLHGPRPITVVIDDPEGVPERYHVAIRYDGFDVTRSFLLQAKVRRARSGTRLALKVSSIRLFPNADHLIEVRYRSASGARAASRYQAPICHAFEGARVLGTGDFAPPKELLSMIDELSRQAGFNPAFATGLIAQESGFNPRTVSLARAIGLTQVTPLAETEVSEVYDQWPRYPGINDLPAPLVKLLVETGKANERNEWRLDEARSIRGGLAFARMLAERWQDSEAFSKIRWSSEDPEVTRTKLVLASYNSGYARVLAAVNRYGAGWLTAPELREARRYVNRIFSYCDHFSEDEAYYENET